MYYYSLISLQQAPISEVAYVLLQSNFFAARADFRGGLCTTTV